MKILLVDDSATLRFTMESYIREDGHETVLAENGEKAVQIIDQFEDDIDIDMIIMDVEMPGLNGFETTRLIRENLADHWIPIIFVTGQNDEKDFEQGIAVGGDDYLIKPISKVILKAKVKAMERIANMRTELHTLNETLTQLSQRDSLTHLYNRRTFEERANDGWREMTKNKQPVAVLLLDIDFFKRYNDTYGHIAGDDCIVKIAEVINDSFNRVGDIVARYGGEEFIVFLPNIDRAGATYVAEQLIKTVVKLDIPHTESPDYQRVTVSIGGCSLRTTYGSELNHLIHSADKSLYIAKKEGRNRAHICNHGHIHRVVLIDHDIERVNDANKAMQHYFDLSIVQHVEDLESVDSRSHAELIILAIEEANDESVAMYREFKKKGKLYMVPLLLVSSLPKEEISVIAEELGATDSISYPIDPDFLIEKIDYFIGVE